MANINKTSNNVNDFNGSQDSTSQKNKYVVSRDGVRVSDKEYDSQNDPLAIEERNYWQAIANRWSYGEPVKIEKYNSKHHRIW